MHKADSCDMNVFQNIGAAGKCFVSLFFNSVCNASGASVDTSKLAVV